tara:strand:- start:78336 stop:78695 length:360 start_codon:yes stop_codon:yes gene_type:complete
METKQIISGAANAYTVFDKDGRFVQDIVIVDSCHFGRNMQSLLKLLESLGCKLVDRVELGDRGQGFIDQSGVYFNRADAYKVAKASGQPFNDQFVLPRDKLDSSCIRHFEKDTDWKEYL